MKPMTSPCAPPSDSPKNRNSALITPSSNAVLATFDIGILIVYRRSAVEFRSARASDAQWYSHDMVAGALVIAFALARAQAQQPVPQPFPRPGTAQPAPAPQRPAPPSAPGSPTSPPPAPASP